MLAFTDTVHSTEGWQSRRSPCLASVPTRSLHGQDSGWSSAVSGRAQTMPPRAPHRAGGRGLARASPTPCRVPVYSSVQYRPVTACVCTGCVGHQISTTDRTHAWVLCWGAPVLGGPESVGIVLNSSSGTATKRVAFHASSQVKETRTGEPFPREGTVHIKLSALRG